VIRLCGSGHRSHCLLVVARGVSRLALASWFLPSARPQGFRPLTNPLRSTHVAMCRAPDAPLGFAPRRSVSMMQGPSESPPGQVSEHLFRASRAGRGSSVQLWSPGASMPAGRSLPRWSPLLPPRGSEGSLRGAQVRSSLTRPPSWLAPCPAGCPAGVRAPPTRPAPAPEGVSTRGPTPGTTSSGCLRHGRVVILSRLLRRHLPGPKALLVRPLVSKDLPGLPERSTRGCLLWLVGALPLRSAASCRSRGPCPAGPSSRQAEALACGAEPRSVACDLSCFPRLPFVFARGRFGSGGRRSS
jgi:hypothetical protein